MGPMQVRSVVADSYRSRRLPVIDLYPLLAPPPLCDCIDSFSLPEMRRGASSPSVRAEPGLRSHGDPSCCHVCIVPKNMSLLFTLAAKLCLFLFAQLFCELLRDVFEKKNSSCVYVRVCKMYFNTLPG